MEFYEGSIKWQEFNGKTLVPTISPTHYGYLTEEREGITRSLCLPLSVCDNRVWICGAKYADGDEPSYGLTDRRFKLVSSGFQYQKNADSNWSSGTGGLGYFFKAHTTDELCAFLSITHNIVIENRTEIEGKIDFEIYFDYASDSLSLLMINLQRSGLELIPLESK